MLKTLFAGLDPRNYTWKQYLIGEVILTGYVVWLIHRSEKDADQIMRLTIERDQALGAADVYERQVDALIEERYGKN